MSKITFAFAAILALQIASGNVISRRVEDQNIENTVAAAIAQFEAEVKHVVEVHQKTENELKKFETETELLIARGEAEVLKFYREISKTIDQASNNDNNNSCKNDANENLSISLGNAWEAIEKSLLNFGKEHVYPSEETGNLVKKTESLVGRYLLESWLCEKGDDPCFKEVLDDVQEEREYLRENLQKRVDNQQQEIIAAELFLLNNSPNLSSFPLIITHPPASQKSRHHFSNLSESFPRRILGELSS